MTKQPEKMIVTIALPYANGELHLGHMLEAIQADIWVRCKRMQGEICWYICGQDAHGTAIMLSAEKAGVTPEEWIADLRAAHQRDFEQFLISFDNFYTTHSAENQALSADIFKTLQENGDIVSRTISQAFDPVKKIFLADRFIKGACPKCGVEDQYGDNCEACGTTYSPAELKNPVSVISGAVPVEKESLHLFFQLNNYKDMLVSWVGGDHLQPQVANKLREWFDDSLRDWDISRDAPYFGFEIPGFDDKYFYVWLDAPIGYMASFKNLCDQQSNIEFDDYWASDSNTKLYHFIGKDIVYFHALFWPAILKGAGYRTPDSVFVHGYLTVNGQKMSKSRGTFITAKDYLAHFNPEYLRYYFAARLNAQIEDIDLSFADFQARVNSDLVGKFVNLASRCAGFIHKKFAGRLSSALPNAELFNEFVAKADEIKRLYAELEYNRCMREIMALADKANQYIDHEKPWALAKDESTLADVQAVCSEGLNLFRILTLFLKPVLPQTAAKVEAFLNIDPLTWTDVDKPLLDHVINPFKPLIQRITPEALAALEG